MIRVVIAEDSPTTAQYIKSILESSGDFEVLTVARDGEEAVSATREMKPSVVLMDINMPRMNGFEATRTIMENTPVPIVIFSASWNPEDVDKTFRAMEAGALAVLEKPSGPNSPGADRMIAELVETVRLMSDVPVVRRWNRRSEESRVARPVLQTKGAPRVPSEIVAIGASTGGPPVLHEILSALPATFAAPVLVVQHISVGFIAGMVEWLDRSCALTVQVARHHEPVLPGRVYFAPDRLHMGVGRGGRIVLSDTPPVNGVRPSISHLFQSVAGEYGKRSAGVLLTGMGRDGARELALIKDCGGVTVVQDRESSVVYGMPGEAVKIGAAGLVQDPVDITQTLMRIVEKR
jgi:two-component system chemotaxis response regulator CheB